MRTARLLVGGAAVATLAALVIPASAASQGSGTGSAACTGADGTLTWTPTTLWPPNHQMVPVTISYTDTDASNDTPEMTESTAVMITGVTETDGGTTTNALTQPGDTLHGSGAPGSVQGPDAVLGATSAGSDPSPAATASVQLRAERAGTDGHSGGRVYAISVSCTDSGTEMTSSGSATIDVTVPHDQGQ